MMPALLTTPIERKRSVDFTKSDAEVAAQLAALGMTFSRASTRRRWNQDNTLTTLASGEAPLTWIPGIGQRYKPEIAIISRWTYTNLVAQSVWTKNGYTVPGTSKASPASDASSYWCPETATTATHEISRTQSVSAGTAYGLHAVVEMVGRQYIALMFKATNGAFTGQTVVFDTVNGTIFSNPDNIPAIIFKRGNYVELFAVVTGSATATGTMALVGCNDSGVPSTTTTYAGDTSKGFWWFNFGQVSARTVPPVMINTTAASTLTADVITMPMNTGRMDSNDICIVAEYNLMPYLKNSTAVLFVMAGDGGNLGQVYLNMATDNMLVQSSSGGVSVFAGISVSTGKSRLAAGFSRGRSLLAVSSQAVRGGSGARLQAFSTIYIGCARTGGNQWSHGIAKIDIYTRCLPLQRLAQLSRGVTT